MNFNCDKILLILRFLLQLARIMSKGATIPNETLQCAMKCEKRLCFS